LLDVARIEAGRGIELHPESTELRPSPKKPPNRSALIQRHQLVSHAPELAARVGRPRQSGADSHQPHQQRLEIFAGRHRHGAAHATEQSVYVSVRDEGPGIAPGAARPLVSAL
jgi:signal transduction histidine kinase